MLSRFATWWKHLFLRWSMLRKFDRGRSYRVFEHVWRGELDDARKLLEAADHPANHFQLACIALEQGKFDVAERWVLKLPGDDPLRRVTVELIGRRSSVPGAFRGTEATWLASLDAAWEAAGRPDLRKHAALGEDFPVSLDEGDATALDISDRVVWMAMTERYGLFPRSKPEDVRAWSVESVDRSAPELVIAFHHLTGGVEAAKMEAEAARVIDALAVQVPENLFVQLHRFLIRKPVFDAKGLAQLESLLVTPTTNASVSPVVYDRFEHVARLAGSKSPEPLAFAGWCKTLITPPLVPLLEGLERSTGTSQRTLAELCLRIGRRCHDDGSLIGFVIGTALIRRAAKVLDRQDVFNELAGYQDESRLYGPVGDHLRLDPQLWPLPTMHCEYLRICRLGERKHYRDMLRRQGVLKA